MRTSKPGDTAQLSPPDGDHSGPFCNRADTELLVTVSLVTLGAPTGAPHLDNRHAGVAPECMTSFHLFRLSAKRQLKLQAFLGRPSIPENPLLRPRSVRAPLTTAGSGTPFPQTAGLAHPQHPGRLHHVGDRAKARLARNLIRGVLFSSATPAKYFPELLPERQPAPRSGTPTPLLRNAPPRTAFTRFLI